MAYETQKSTLGISGGNVFARQDPIQKVIDKLRPSHQRYQVRPEYRALVPQPQAPQLQRSAPAIKQRQDLVDVGEDTIDFWNPDVRNAPSIQQVQQEQSVKPSVPSLFSASEIMPGITEVSTPLTKKNGRMFTNLLPASADPNQIAGFEDYARTSNRATQDFIKQNNIPAIGGLNSAQEVANAQDPRQSKAFLAKYGNPLIHGQQEKTLDDYLAENGNSLAAGSPAMINLATKRYNADRSMAAGKANREVEAQKAMSQAALNKAMAENYSALAKNQPSKKEIAAQKAEEAKRTLLAKGIAKINSDPSFMSEEDRQKAKDELYNLVMLDQRKVLLSPKEEAVSSVLGIGGKDEVPAKYGYKNISALPKKK